MQPEKKTPFVDTKPNNYWSSSDGENCYIEDHYNQ